MQEIHGAQADCRFHPPFYDKEELSDRPGTVSLPLNIIRRDEKIFKCQQRERGNPLPRTEGRGIEDFEESEKS